MSGNAVNNTYVLHCAYLPEEGKPFFRRLGLQTLHTAKFNEFRVRHFLLRLTRDFGSRLSVQARQCVQTRYDWIREEKHDLHQQSLRGWLQHQLVLGARRPSSLGISANMALSTTFPVFLQANPGCNGGLAPVFIAHPTRQVLIFQSELLVGCSCLGHHPPKLQSRHCV